MAVLASTVGRETKAPPPKAAPAGKAKDAVA